MSIKMMFAAMEITTGSPVTKLVLVKLADNANDQGECWPSHDTIARICEMSVKTSQRHVRKLEELGLVSIQTRKGKNGNLSNFYKLSLVASNSLSEQEAEASNSRPPSDRESLGGSVTESPESVSSFKPVNESSSCQNSNEFPRSEESLPPKKIDHTPYVKIINLYHEVLPWFNSVRRYDSLKDNIRARHKTIKNGIDGWKSYFEYIRDNCKWMYSGDYGSANKLSYIVNKSNFEDILNGGKDDR